MKAFRLPLLFLAFAAVCGLLRWIQTYYVISAGQVRFAHLNDITWDYLGNRAARTGSDPYLVFDLPAGATPIRTVTFEFIGDYVETEGVFYIFQSDGPVLNATVQKGPDSLRISANLNRSTSLRLDLPDFLPRTIQLDRILIRRPFVDWSAWSFRLMLLTLTGGFITLLLALRRRRIA